MSRGIQSVGAALGTWTPFMLENFKRAVAAITGRLSRRAFIVLALWALFIVWTAWGAVFNVAKALEIAFGRANPYDPAPALFALNLWGCLAGLVVGLIILNPFKWLNGKRLVFGCMAFAMMLGRLVSGTLTGPVLYAASMNKPLMFLLAPVVLLFGGAGVIIAIFAIIIIVFLAFVSIPMMVFSQILQFDNALHIYRHRARGLANYVVRFMYWLRNEPSPDSPPDESKGARLATMPEIVKIHKPAAPEAMAFGHIGNPLFLKTDKHVLIMASTRSGKGVTLIIPHLLRYQGSAFVLDPKGENARATGRQRAHLNQEVHYLDPFGISGKPQSRFNPLSRFTPENMEAESKALAAALFVLGERERDHWTDSGQQLLASIILYVYVSSDVPAQSKDLPTVRRILLGGLKPALNAMTKIDDADGLLRDLAMSFLETPEKEFGSIISTAQRQTEILDNPYIVACLSASGPGQEADFSAWHRGTMTVYLCLSAPKFPVFNRWLRLVLTSALDEMTDTLNPPPLPVCFMLDELATLGHLTAVENAVGLAAGYGIQLVTVFQDVAQMRDLYKGRWASFIGNAGARAVFNLDDYETADYWSKFIGGSLVETRSTQQDIYGFSKGDNVGEAMRPLFPPDKIMMEFASGKMLVLAQGSRPIITDRVAYWNDKSLDGLWDDPRTQIRLPAPARLAPRPPANGNSQARPVRGQPSPERVNVPQEPSGNFPWRRAPR